MSNPLEHSVASSLIRQGQSQGWAKANPYTLRYVALHARAGGLLPDLIQDPTYLASAEPEILASAIGTGFDDASGGDPARMFLRCMPAMRDLGFPDRLSLLAAESLRQRIGIRMRRDPSCAWWPRWTSLDPTPFNRALYGHSGSVQAVAFIGSEPLRCVSGAEDGLVRIWDLEEGVAAAVLEGHTAPITCLAVSELNGHEVIVSGSEDGVVLVWNIQLQSEIGRIQGHGGGLRDISIASIHGNSYLATASNDGWVRVFSETDFATPIRVLGGYEQGVRAVEFSSSLDGTLVFGTHEGSLNVWDAFGTNSVGEIGRLRGPVRSLATNLGRGSAMLLAFAGGDDRVILLSAEDYSTHLVIEGNEFGVNALSFTNDGRSLISAGFNGSLRQWDTMNGSLQREYKGSSTPIRSLAVMATRAGEYAITGGFDRTVRLWDLSTPLLVSQPDAWSMHARSGCLLHGLGGGAPLFVVAAEDGFVSLLNDDTGRVQARIKVSSTWIRAVSEVLWNGSSWLLAGDDDGHLTFVSSDVADMPAIVRRIELEGWITAIVTASTSDGQFGVATDLGTFAWFGSPYDMDPTLLQLDERLLCGVAFDGGFAVGGEQGALFYLARRGEGVRLLYDFGEPVTALASTTNPARLVVGTTKGAFVVDPITGSVDVVRGSAAEHVSSLATWPGGGSRVAFALQNQNRVEIIDLERGPISTVPIAAPQFMVPHPRGVLIGSHEGLTNLEVTEPLRQG